VGVSRVLESFLRKARRRHLINLVLDQSAIAFSAAAAGSILLLLVGTEILNWYWLAILFTGSLALGIYRMRNAIPSDYLLAQRIDRRLEMRDGLSTAYYFRDRERPGLPVLKSQVEDRLTGPDQIRRAVPLRVPRSTYSFAGLLAIVAGLFAVRYGITHTLDVRAPIAHFSFGNFSTTASARETPRKSAIREQLDEQLKQMGLSLEQIDSPPGEGEKSTDKTLPTVVNPDGRNPVAAPEKGKNISDKASAQDGSEVEGSDKSESGKPGDNADASSQEGASGGPQQAGKPQTPPSGSKAASNNSNEGSSVLDKMRDAMSNLLSKLKTPSKAQDAQQGSAQSANSASKQQTNQKGMQGQSKSQGEGQSSTDQPGDQDSDAGDKAQSAQSKSGDKNADKPSNQDSKSGQGKQDGDKAIRDAEQLAAMGKISELIGKRAAQVTGEMTVEVPAGKQQLKTLYSQKKALHADAGSEVNRDEIPLMYQPYVQRYYEELRKSAPKTKN
jgi:hypothetical protein